MLDIIELVASLDVKMIRWLIKAAKRKANFSASELFILWKIHSKGSAKIGDLSYDVGVPPSTLTGMLDRFEAQGYVVRVHDTTDRRSVLICETPKLGTLVEEWKSAVNSEIETFCATLPEGFLDQLRKDLIILQQSIERNEGHKRGRTTD